MTTHLTIRFWFIALYVATTIITAVAGAPNAARANHDDEGELLPTLVEATPSPMMEPVTLPEVQPVTGDHTVYESHEYTIYLPFIARSEKYPPHHRDYELEVIRLINQVRAEHGLTPPLIEEPVFTRAARRHAIDMAVHEFAGHIGSDKSNPWSRIVEEGGFGEWLVGEAAGFGYESPTLLVNALMDSPPHRHILLVGNTNRIGVGAARIISEQFPNRFTWVVVIGNILPYPPRYTTLKILAKWINDQRVAAGSPQLQNDGFIENIAQFIAPPLNLDWREDNVCGGSRFWKKWQDNATFYKLNWQNGEYAAVPICINFQPDGTAEPIIRALDRFLNENEHSKQMLLSPDYRLFGISAGEEFAVIAVTLRR